MRRGREFRAAKPTPSSVDRAELRGGTVTAIEPQRRRGGERVNVYVDGRYALSLDATLAATLRVEQELDAATLARLTTEDEHQRAFNAACLFLSYRPRSVHEVETRLRQRGFTPEAIAAARAHGIHPGYALGRDYEGLDDVVLVAVTEKRTPEEIDRLADLLAEVGKA
jgi:hypothetical protein